jgi:hypothetical protein
MRRGSSSCQQSFPAPENLLKVTTDIALIVFTAILAWATIKLANYTQALSKLTEQLVRIEAQRDEREQKENRRKDLSTALSAAANIQKIDPQEFALRLNSPTELPLEEMTNIDVLHSLKRYIKDPDCHQHLDSLCSTFDSVRREKFQVRIHETEIAARLETLQNRLQWFMDETRTEISV